MTTRRNRGCGRYDPEIWRRMYGRLVFGWFFRCRITTLMSGASPEIGTTIGSEAPRAPSDALGQVVRANEQLSRGSGRLTRRFYWSSASVD